jgi:hypothetical protein
VLILGGTYTDPPPQGGTFGPRDPYLCGTSQRMQPDRASACSLSPRQSPIIVAGGLKHGYLVDGHEEMMQVDILNLDSRDGLNGNSPLDHSYLPAITDSHPLNRERTAHEIEIRIFPFQGLTAHVGPAFQWFSRWKHRCRRPVDSFQRGVFSAFDTDRRLRYRIQRRTGPRVNPQAVDPDDDLRQFARHSDFQVDRAASHGQRERERIRFQSRSRLEFGCGPFDVYELDQDRLVRRPDDQPRGQRVQGGW